MKNRFGQVKVFAEGIPHPEGIAIGTDDWLYTGSASPDHTGPGCLYRISPDGKKVRQFADTKGRVLGLDFDDDGLLFTCDVLNSAVITVDRKGRCNVFADRAGERMLQKPNFLAFDPSGDLIVSDSGTAKAGEATGAVYRFSPDGSGETLVDGLVFPNGIAFDEDHQYLYVVLTRDNSIIKVPILEDGSAGKPVPFADGLNNGPDGVAVDGQGNVFVTVTRPSQIAAFSPEGERLAEILDAEDKLLAAPSNVAFGGERQQILFIANLFGNHISYIDLEE